jgi:hypothetical protein
MASEELMAAPAKTVRTPVKKAATKTAVKPKTKPATKKVAKVKTVKAEKIKKPKMVRDSFTMPKPEYAAIAALKLRAAKHKQAVKKGELIRAGLKVLAGMSDDAFLKVVRGLPGRKTASPKAA